MKRITLLAVLALMVAVVVPAMAGTTVGIAGAIGYGVISNGTVAADNWQDAYMNIIGTIDANNSIELALMGTNMPKILSTPPQLARWLLPISPTSF